VLIALTLLLMMTPAPHAYDATPQAAALRVFGGAGHVARTNVVGRFATVLVPDGMMEGSRATAPLLLEHFSFGWQPIESLDFRCRLDGHVADFATRRALMAGMPTPRTETACGADRDAGDVGPAADVATIRLLMTGPLVPTVRIAGDNALAEWYGAGGGQDLFRRQGQRWRFVTGGGGMIDAAYLRQLGVPSATACTLAVDDATCAKH
jgi:hypothetical protein